MQNRRQKDSKRQRERVDGSGHNRPSAYMNPQRQGQHAQDLGKFKSKSQHKVLSLAEELLSTDGHRRGRVSFLQVGPTRVATMVDGPTPIHIQAALSVPSGKNNSKKLKTKISYEIGGEGIGRP